MIKRTYKKKIGVAGLARSGKTVFLTSLINHLVEHSPDNFNLHPCAAKIERARVISTGELDHFKYHQYRAALAHKGSSPGTWPTKTTDTSKYVIEFERSDWSYSKVELQLFDFPGERMADAAIARFRTYDEWSKWILNEYSEIRPHRTLSEEYIKDIEDGTPKMEDVLSSYKNLLLKYFDAYLPLVTPSCFLLDREGNVLPRHLTKDGGGLTDSLRVENRYSGLPENAKGMSQEFAPVPESVFQKKPDFLKLFRRNYKRYRAEVVLPVFQQLYTCDGCIVLVNIPGTLSGDVGRLNMSRRILKDLMSFFEPESIWTSIAQWTAWGISLGIYGEKRAKRIAFVASMCDLVCATDREDKMKGLLKDISRQATESLKDIDVKHFVVAAACSTVPANGQHLEGVPIHKENPNVSAQIFKVSELPEKWPDSWEQGEYVFHRVAPDVPVNEANPPKQTGLNNVFNFLIQ